MKNLPVVWNVYALEEALPLQESSYYLLYLIEGSLTVRTRQGSCHLRGGDLLMVIPEDQGELIPEEKAKTVLIDMEDTFVREAMGTFCPVFLLNTAVSHRDCADLERLIYRLLSQKAGAEHDRLLQSSLIYELLFLLKTSYLLPMEGESTNAAADPRRDRLARYLSLHYGERLTLEDTAAQFGLTPQYFARYFKKTFGVTFLDYLTELRLRHACRELMAGGADVTAVAFSNGFTNLTSFYQAFRRAYGCAPGQFRERQRDAPGLKTISPEEALPILEAHRHLEATENNAPLISEKMTVQLHRPFSHSWEEILNLGSAMNLMKWNFLHQVADVVQKRGIGFRYIRVSGVLSERLSPQIRPGEYDFSFLERMLISIMENRGLPMLELAELSRWSSSDDMSIRFQSGTPYEGSMEEWLEKLKTTLLWLRNRWGPEHTTGWRFSLFADSAPDYDSEPEKQNVYCRRFRESVRLIKSILPGAEVGGPGVDIGMPLEEFRHLITAMTETGPHPDFITLTMYPSYMEVSRTPLKRVLRPCYEPAFAREQKLRQILGWLGEQGWASVPVYVVGASSELLMGRETSDSCHRAAWFAGKCLSCDVAGLACFGFSDLEDICSDHRPELFGGRGMLTQHELPKPILYAHEMLRQLGPELIRRSENYIVTTDGAGTYAIFMHNRKELSRRYCDSGPDISLSDSFEDGQNLRLRLLLEQLEPGTYTLETIILNERHGSIRSALETLGKADGLTEADCGYLLGVVVPLRQYRTVTCGNSFRLDAVLLPNEVRLVRMARVK